MPGLGMEFRIQQPNSSSPLNPIPPPTAFLLLTSLTAKDVLTFRPVDLGNCVARTAQVHVLA